MQTEDFDGKTLETWTPDEVKQALDEGKVVLVDVRTPPEYMMDHIEGAMLMPMSFFKPAALPGQEGKRIVLHCGSGVRSKKCAAAYLQDVGEVIAHMGGGMAGWRQAGLPVTAIDMSTGAPRKVG